MRRLYEGEKILDAQDIKEMSRKDSHFHKNAILYADSYLTFRKCLNSFRNKSEDDLIYS